MHYRAIKQLLVATLFFCSSTVLLWSVLSWRAAQKTKELSAPELVFGAGMRSSLMTPTPINKSNKSSKNTFDDLDDLFESIRELEVGGTMTIRRYKNTLIAGEGWKLYIDYGDGSWVPWEDGNFNSIQTDDIADPFGDALSDTGPFD